MFWLNMSTSLSLCLSIFVINRRILSFSTFNCSVAFSVILTGVDDCLSGSRENALGFSFYLEMD